MFNASRILGPAVAGLLIGAFDISIAFLINGISYIAVIVAYLRCATGELRPMPTIVRPTTVRGVFEIAGRGRPLRPPHADRAARRHGRRSRGDVRDELPGARSRRYADNILHVGASGYGFLMAASGLGSTVAALTDRVPAEGVAAADRPGRDRARPRLDRRRALDVVRAVAARDGHRRGRRHRHGRDREHDDPAVGSGPSPGPGDEPLHDGLRGLRAGGRPADGLRSPRRGACRCR